MAVSHQGLLAPRRQDVTLYLAALGVFPLLLLALNSSWAFPQAGYIDPWIYIGYHMHFKMLWNSSPAAYYGSRVPWTVLGYAVHRLFSPGVSLVVLALLLFYASIYSLFYAIYTTYRNSSAAFVAACLLGTNSWFLLAIGWNYVDGPSIACTLLGLAALVMTARGRSYRTGSFIWGALSAALVALYPMNLVLLPLEILIFLGLDRLANRRAGVQIAALWCAGLVGSTLAMAVANWAAGGRLDFVTPTLGQIMSLTPQGTNDIYVVAWHIWLPVAVWLLVPASVFATAIVYVFVQRDRFSRFRQPPVSEPDDAADTLVLAVGLVVAVCGFLFMQALNFTALSLFYRANSLLPFAFLAVGGFLSAAFAPETRRVDAVFALGAALLCFGPWLLGFLNLLKLPLLYDPVVQSPLLLQYPYLFIGPVKETLWMLAGAALLWFTVTSRYRSLALCTVAVASITGVCTLSPGNVIRLPQESYYRDVTLAILAASTVIDKEFDTPPTIWWDPNDPYKFAFSSLGIMYFRQIPATITAGERVVFIRSSDFPAKNALSPFVDKRFILTQVDERHVQRGATGFDLMIGTVQQLAPKR